MLNSSHSLMHRLEEASSALKRAAVSSLALQERHRSRLAGRIWADRQQHWTVFAPQPEFAGLRGTRQRQGTGSAGASVGRRAHEFKRP